MDIPFAALTRKALTPLMVVCLLAALASSGMILLTGVWFPLWPPLFGVMLSPLVFPLLVFPAAFFSGVMRAAGTAYPKVAKVCMILTFAWFVGILGMYVFLVFHISQVLMLPDTPTRMPALIWTIAIAVLPWAIFATRDRENILFTGMIYMMLVAAMVSVPLVFFFVVPAWIGFWIFCSVMASLLSLQALYERFFMAPYTPAPTAPSDNADG